MQGTVAVVVRLLDIVLLFENLHISLPFKDFGYTVYIIYIVADNAHTGNIVDIFFSGGNGKRNTFLCKLCHNALRRFYPAFNMMNGAA